MLGRARAIILTAAACAIAVALDELDYRRHVRRLRTLGALTNEQIEHL